MSDRPIYVDIDGTLTADGERGGADPLGGRIEVVRKMIQNGRQVVIWSGRGTRYAREFAARHDLEPLACVGKPELCVDDNPTIRPREHMEIHAPENWFGETGE